jgi:DNA-binding LytR/AlgR family response regulator
MLIFTTAHSEFALDGFNLNALDYLLKPYSYQRFLQASEKANAHFRSMRNTTSIDQLSILIRADYSLKKILIDDILFIEGSDDYIKIHLKNDTRVVTRMTVKAMLSQLPGREFIRVHRSYIIPINKINQVRNKVIKIGTEEIPIGVSYEEDFFNRYLS